ncbi:hypothetical protein ACFL35_17605 [Candidatus Riflebacteria bacterium]
MRKTIAFALFLLFIFVQNVQARLYSTDNKILIYKKRKVDSSYYHVRPDIQFRIKRVKEPWVRIETGYKSGWLLTEELAENSNWGTKKAKRLQKIRGYFPETQTESRRRKKPSYPAEKFRSEIYKTDNEIKIYKKKQEDSLYHHIKPDNKFRILLLKEPWVFIQVGHKSGWILIDELAENSNWYQFSD